MNQILEIYNIAIVLGFVLWPWEQLEIIGEE